ncbi:MAG: Ig-like domain-containing protein [Bacilli bacterium]|nr:Ig-like domain-containing protein [Bacilli bacterium]
MNDDDDYLDEYDDEIEDSSSSNGFMTFYEENKKLVWVLCGVIFLIILMLILGGGSSNKAVDTEVTMSSTSESVGVNNSVKLELKVNNDNNPNVNWSSSDPSVATVDKGLVKAVSRGKTTITATYTDRKNKTFSKTCEVTVFEGSAGVNLLSVSFKDGTVVMSPNSSYKLSYNKSPINAMVTSVNYSSTNENVVRVDKNTGELNAVTIGSSTVRVEVNNSMTATITVNVIDKQLTPNIYLLPSSLMIKKNEYNLVEGEKKRIEFSYLPSNATLKFVEWTSSNTSAAMIDENGYITAMGPGDAKITLSCGGVTSTAMVHVSAKEIPVKSITTTDKVVNLNVGDTHQILAVVSPANASNQELEYISNNTAIISVDSNGYVRALSKGNTSVRVRSKGTPSVSTSISFNVSKQTTPVDPDGGGQGVGSSVGTVKITSNNNAVQISYENAVKNERTSYPTLTISGSGNYDSIKYCYYTYGSASTCTPNIIYNGPFTFKQNGITVFRARASYRGKDGEILTRYVNIKVNQPQPPAKTDACYCNTSGSCRYGTSSDSYTIYTSLGKNECNAYIGRNNQGCFTNNGKLVWGSYMGKSGYAYVSHVASKNECSNQTTPPVVETNACYCNTDGQCRYGTSGNGYTISTTLSQNACNAYIYRGNKGCFIYNGSQVWGSHMGKSGYAYISTVSSSTNCGGSTPPSTSFTVNWGTNYGFNPPLTSVRGIGYKVNSSSVVKRIYFCESNTSSPCTINYNNAVKTTKHFDLRVASGNTYDTKSTYNQTFYFEDLSGNKFDFFIMTEKNHYLSVIAMDSNGYTSNSDTIVVNK